MNNEGLSWVSAKLIIFTAFTAAVTLWLASIIGNFQFFASPYEIKAEFTDATGLLNGDVVKAAGVTLGRVESIQVRNGLAIVTMSIDEDARIPADVEAEVRFRNLIGQRMIKLVQPDTTTDALLRDGDLISLDRTDPAFDLSDLFNGLRPLIRSTNPADINTVAREVTTALRGREDNLAGLLSNVSDISDMLAAKDQQLSTLLDGLNIVSRDLAGRDQQLERTLGYINEFFAKVLRNRRSLARALVVLEDAAVRIENLVDNNAENIDASLESLADILEVVERRRGDLESIVRGLPAVLTAVERVTGYGEWTNIHLIDVCKDDFGVCGTRGTP